MLGKQLALIVLIVFAATSFAQHPGDKLTLHQYSVALRKLTNIQARANYQLQQGSSMALRRPMSTMRAAMLELRRANLIYIDQLDELRTVYARLQPPASAKKLNDTFISGISKLIALTRATLKPLEVGDEAALKKVRVQISAFMTNFPAKIRNVVTRSGFDYKRYSKDCELVKAVR